MNLFFIKRVARMLLCIGLLAFFFLGFLGLGHFGMTDSAGQMSNCHLIMGIATLCQMNLLEHITAWQNLFVADLQKDAFTLLAALLLSLLFTLSIQYLRVAQKIPQLINVRHQYAYLKIATPDTSTPLHDAFSNGILNPKLF